MNEATRRFRALFEAFLESSHRLFPHEASDLGLEEFDGQLGKNEPSTHIEWTKLLRGLHAEVEALPDHAFEGDDWLDRRGFLAMLRTQLLFHGRFERWRTNPQVHANAAIQAIFGLITRNTGNLQRILPAVERRLKLLPGFLEAGAACVRKPVPLWVRLAQQTCEGSGSFLEGIESALGAVSPHPAKTADLCRGARRAFEEYARAISRKAPGAAGSFAIGRDVFELLIRERLGMPLSLPEAEAAGWALVERFTGEVKKEAARFGRKPAREIIAEASRAWSPGEEGLLAEYQRVTYDVRDKVSKAGILSLPKGETLQVLPVPDFMRHSFPTAAYLSPGPFAKKQEGIFWVNDLSLQQKDHAAKEREIRQHFGLELTCAHEAYPGHHVQFVIQNRHRSRLRRLCSHAIYYEGWTLWCEKMCIDHGIYSAPHARLAQLSDALWRACRIVIDCGLHSGRLTFNGAAGLLEERAGFTRSRAAGDVNWYTSAPTVPMSYLLGRLEVERLHRKLVLADKWSLRQFNDWMLSFGAIPWNWIWQSQLR